LPGEERLVGVFSDVEVGEVTSEPSPPPAFEAYAAARWDRLRRSAYLLGLDAHAAEDAAQTTLATCYLKWARVSRADDVDAYVHRVLINTIASGRRRRSSGERPSGRLPEQVVPDGAGRVEATTTVRSALGRLPLAQRQVIVLRFYADLTEGQTATILKIPLGTVKSRCSRALRALAQDPALREEGSP
jgi:RNA polymerase sigma-70 factor (sigma-E family)